MADGKSVEEKIIFALAPPTDKPGGNGNPVLMLGIPKGAWDYMKDGMCHTFDLTKIGLPVQLVVFGGNTHESTLADLHRAIGQIPVVDLRSADFSIKTNKKEH
jgi:hypothetical protein